MNIGTKKSGLAVTEIIELVNTALDGVDHRLVSHGLRVGMISHKMLCMLGEDNPLYLQDAFMAALLHDVGAYKTDDINKMVVFESRQIWEHSLYGYLFLHKFSPLAHMAQAVLYHHLDFAHMGHLPPKIARLAQVLHLCDRVDVYLQSGKDVSVLRRNLDKESGTRFDPELVELFWQADEECGFTTLPFDQWQVELCMESWVSAYKLQTYLEMVVSMIDFKSNFTVTHSITTQTISVELAQYMGLPEEEIQQIWLGSLLHDVGKLYVPVSVVEHPGRLDAQQLATMRKHVDGTRKVLEGKISDEVLEIACRHHEKLNGSGYPRGLSAPELNMAQRIVCVADITSALSCERSYKPAFSREKTQALLDRMTIAGELDAGVVQVLYQNYEAIQKKVKLATQEVQATYNKLMNAYEILMEKRQQMSIEEWLMLLDGYVTQGYSVLQQA